MRRPLSDMDAQEGRIGPISGTGSGSPPGPDSTWEETLQGSRMEARFVILEQRLLRDQEEKFFTLMEVLRREPKIETVSAEVGELRTLIEEKIIPMMERMESSGMDSARKETSDKLDLMVQGGKEADKLNGSIVSSVEKVQRSVDKLEEIIRKDKGITMEESKYTLDNTQSLEISRKEKYEDVKGRAGRKWKRTRSQ